MIGFFRKKSTALWLYALAFLALFLFLLWKCRFGYPGNDEAFYLTIPYRLCRGDSLILHEWHLSQLSGFLLYPLMKAYLFFVGSTEGILLHFRYIYTVVWALSALFVFDRLKGLSLYGAMLASLCFLIYAPFGIMALSYNSMGIQLLLCACVIPAGNTGHRPLPYLASGVLFAGAVLCCPYLVLVYVVFSLTVLLQGRRYKNLVTAWGMISLGCLVLLLIFAMFLLRRASPSAIVSVIPQLLRDPEHAAIPLSVKTLKYLEHTILCNRVFPYALLLTLCVMFVSKWKNAPVAGFFAMLLLIAAVQMDFLLEKPYLNSVMFPLNLVAPYCVLHSKEKKIRLPFCSVWLPGFLYTYCISLTSNQRFHAISSASTVMTVASAVILVAFISDLPAEKPDRRRLLAATAAAVFALQFFSQVSLRYLALYGESTSMGNMTVCADQGPEKGIRMSPERLAEVSRQNEDIASVRREEGVSRFLALSRRPRLYLCAEMDIAAFSAWLSGVNDESIRRLDAYYELFPEKRPDVIYVEEEYSQYTDHFAAMGYTCRQLPSGAWLLR